MAIIERNIRYEKIERLSSFRKVALGTWRTVGDPSVYSEIAFNVEPALDYLQKLNDKNGSKLTLTHFVGKACAETIKNHQEINCILRWGRLYRRSTTDIFFHVAADLKGEDLTGTVVRQIDQKSILQIGEELQAKVKKIRQSGDIDYREMKKLFRKLPAFLSRTMIDLSSYIMYTLNIWSPLLGVPKDSFGSMMITSIGSIGLERAFVPLVPYSRIPLLIAIGSVREAPWIVGGKVEVRKVMSLCVTFDHRVIDGMHASHMAKTMKAIFEDPEKTLGPV